MSRSNNNNGQSGPPPRPAAPQWRHPADTEPYAQHEAPVPAQGPAPNWVPFQPQPPAQHHAAPQHAQAHGYGQPPAGPPPGQAAYYFPQDQQPAYQPPHFAAQPDPHAHYQRPATRDPQTAPVSGAHPGLASYTPQAQPAPDPRGYDFASFGAGMPQHGQYAPPDGYPPQQQQAHAPLQANWQPQPGPYPAFDQSAQAAAGQVQAQHPGQFGAPHVGHEQAQHDSHSQYEGDYDDQADFDEEPPSRARGFMVVAALVGAISLGGGLAYLYKTYSGGPGGRAPILKADVTPAKSKPATPGGREFANADKKVTERLGDASPQQQVAAAQAAATDSSEVGGPRKVQIIPITPGGAVGAAQPSAQPPRPTIAVPGMVVDAGPARPLPAVVAAPPSAVRPAAVAVQAPPPPARVPAPQQPLAQAAEAVPAPAKRVALAVPKATKSADAYSPAGGVAAAPAPVTGGGNGFVAVLSSQKSRMDALKVYADLQQKYGEVLLNKPADVQEANLGEKGVYYRAVVGPPGSRDSASTLCTQLKAAGFTGCWVTAY